MGKPMTDNISLAEHFKDWVGRRYQRDDVIDRRLVEHFSAMLAPHFSKIPPVPPGLFWCLSPDVLPSEDLGGDGHPRMGLLMPALPLPRRMWAGGELVFGNRYAGDTNRRQQAISGTGTDCVAHSARSCAVVSLFRAYHERTQNPLRPPLRNRHRRLQGRRCTRPASGDFNA